MKEEELKKAMTALHAQFMSDKDIKKTIAKAVQLGMKYQTEKIKAGISVVFDEL